MNSEEGNGKPLLDSNSCLENLPLDLQDFEQTRRATTTSPRRLTSFSGGKFWPS